MSEGKKPTGVVPDLPEPPPEEYPRVFGGYVLLAPLARGGMGEVFLAKHGSVAGLEKHCVVKTLRPHLTDDREYTTRFIDEARIVVQLGHRNICHVFDVGTVGERYYLAMEYIAGKDLRALTHDVGEKGGVVNPGLALHVLCETLEALDYAHRHVDAATGRPLLLVHRDVSPQNVMLSWEGEVKLIDFGLAASTLKMEQTSPNVVMGKLAYMSPEQVRGERVDGRTDLFAAAVMLYELLLGERFYEGRSPYEIWGIAAQGGYRPRGWDALDADMKAILDKALAANPQQRFGTCLEFREALTQYRYARGLHGDAPLLRALMQQVYAPEIEASRAKLQKLTQTPLKDPLAARASGVFSVAQEPTVSLARSPSRSLSNKAKARSRSEPAGAIEGTEPTTMFGRPGSGPRRVLPIAAGLLVLGLLAGGVYTVVVKRSGTTTSPDAGTAAAATTADAGAPAIVDAGAVAVIVDAGTALDVIAVVDAGSAEEEIATDAGPLANGKKKKKVTPKPDPKVEPAPPVEAPPVDVAPVRVHYRKSTWSVRLAELEKKCKLPCAKSALVHKADFGEFTKDPGFQAWADALETCWEKCGLGPTD